MIPYELARRHYHIQRRIEHAPGTQSFISIAKDVADLPLSNIFLLWEHHTETYQAFIPFYLLAKKFSLQTLSNAPETLQKALKSLQTEFLGTLIQEQERLIQDAQLYRYLYARYLLLDNINYWKSWNPSQAIGLPDRDAFRQSLGAYVQLLNGVCPQNPLLEIWNQTAWLQRWQINDTPRQDLPTQKSPRKQIEKYKLPERGKRLYAELDQGLANQDNFLAALPISLSSYLESLPVQFSQETEQRLRECIQITMRHSMKKGFRITTLTSELVNALLHVLPQQSELQSWISYIIIQELVLGTQNLKYRLNDVISGLAQSKLPPYPAVYHGILDCVMEIYESFSLADNAVKSFIDQNHKHQDMQQHQNYTLFTQKLSGTAASA